MCGVSLNQRRAEQSKNDMNKGEILQTSYFRSKASNLALISAFISANYFPNSSLMVAKFLLAVA